LSYGALGDTFPLVASSQWLFFIWYLLLNTVERGLYSVIGPIIIKIFGFHTGTQVFPFKVTSWLAAVIIAPLLHYLFGKIISIDALLVVLGLLVFVALWIATLLRDSYEDEWEMLT
jgi:hypothetical protein